MKTLTDREYQKQWDEAEELLVALSREDNLIGMAMLDLLEQMSTFK